MARSSHTQRARRPTKPPARRAAKRRSGRAPQRRGPRPVVGIGASAGGLEAFSSLLENLPADTGMAFVFVSHLDPKHESILTALLGKTTPMPVVEAKHGMVVRPDHVYVIPRNTRMTIERQTLSLWRRPEAPAENFPIDHFLRSLAEDRKSGAIGVILSGTASDGTVGMKAIKEAGGFTLAQDPGTAKYDGMPRNAIKAGAIDFVLSPREIAAKLAVLARGPHLAGAAARREVAEKSANGLAEVLALLRERTGADFSTYKEATVQRRIRRRMVLNKIRAVVEYARLLQREPAEVDALYEDLLIKVTEFFRDPRTFEKLKTSILPVMFRRKAPKEAFRVWVPGCATGEEAYSLAIVILEVMARLRMQFPVQIFATDLSERAIAAARRGIYPASIVSAVSAQRRRQFFEKAGSEYKIGQRVREICVFARQDLTRNPPFSKVDLISCRNVLIYMGRSLQDSILSVFHYALKPGGCLLLGKAESLESTSHLFTPANSKLRLYRRKPAGAGPLTGFAAHLTAGAAAHPAVAKAAAKAPRIELPRPPVATAPTLRDEATRLILDRFAPSGVVINEQSEILEIIGDPHAYVRLGPGAANLNLMRLARKDLVPQLTAAVDLARRTGSTIRREALPAGDGLHLEVIPMLGQAGDPDRRYLVLFDRTPAETTRAGRNVRRTRRRLENLSDRMTGSDNVRLRKELGDSQEHLRLLMDSRQTAEEELKSANEELMSSMEELQSANEELQTSHEELESTNEELTTVNDQLAIRNRDLTEISNDLSNLVTSVTLPILMLTAELRLRRSTIAADQVLGLTPADIGRHISEIRHALRFPQFEAAATEVLKSLEIKEFEVQDRLNVWYAMRLRPYRTQDDRIDGLVVVLFEIDRLKRSLQEVERARNFSRMIVESVQEPLLVLGEDRRVLTANQAFLKTFRLNRTEIENRLVFELEPAGFDSPDFKRMLDRPLSENLRPDDFEIEFRIGNADPVIMAIDARQFNLREDYGNIILLTMKDITKFRHAEQRLLASRDTVRRGRLRAESSLRESRQELSQSRAELRLLAGRLIRAQEDERKRVARELHDDLSQRLSALQIGSAGLAKLLTEDGQTRAVFEAHQEHLADVVGEVRRLAYDLHPAILTHLGLRAALQSFCVEFSNRERIDVKFSAEKDPPDLPEEVALCLYRVTQEALRNVARHSLARMVGVSIAVRRGVIELKVQDSGKGFERRPDGSGEGLGLLGMKERVRLVYGTLKVRSRPGVGTTIEVQIPLPTRSA